MNTGSSTTDNQATDPKVRQLVQFFSRAAPETSRVFKLLTSRGMPAKEAAAAALEGAVQKELEKGALCWDMNCPLDVPSRRSADHDDDENPSLGSVDTRTREFRNSENFHKMLVVGIQGAKKGMEMLIKEMVAEGKINANNIRTIKEKEALLMLKVNDEWRKRLAEEAWEYRQKHRVGDDNIQITIRIPNRGNIVINHLVAEDTIALVKYIIEKKTQIKADAFNLAIGTHRSMDDDKTLQSYNIVNGSTLILGIKMVTSHRRRNLGVRNLERSGRYLIGLLVDLADNAGTFNVAGDLGDIFSYIPDAITEYIKAVEAQHGGRNRTRKRKTKRRQRKKTRRQKRAKKGQRTKRRRTKRRRTMRKA